MAGLRLARSAAQHGLVHRASDLTEEKAGLGADRVLPVLPQFRQVLPGRGLRRGSVIEVTQGDRPPGSGATSLLLALLAEASRAGSWCAVVGLPALGLAAAAELGVVLDRLALVPQPGAQWSTVVASLLDGFDVVVAAPGGPVPMSIRGQLSARARHRGSVLMPFNGGWGGADLTVSPIRGAWSGLGHGYGRLRCRELTIAVRGRGAAGRPRQATVWLPGSQAEAARYIARDDAELLDAGPLAAVPDDVVSVPNDDASFGIVPADAVRRARPWLRVV